MLFLCATFICYAAQHQALANTNPTIEKQQEPTLATEYSVGVSDVLLINVIQPDSNFYELTVAPDGYISYPFLGRLFVKDKTLSEIQTMIEDGLSNGYLRYPVVSVRLKESRSRQFFVYGEVANPGVFSLEENMTVFKAIAVAGGFTKFGSSNKVKVMRPRQGQGGYDLLKVDLNAIFNGAPDADLALRSGDVVVVAQGVF